MSDIPPAYNAPPATGVRHRGTTSDTVDTTKPSTGAQSQSRIAKIGDEAKASAARQVGGVVNTAREAVGSGAWAYPIRGALYIVSRAFLTRLS